MRKSLLLFSALISTFTMYAVGEQDLRSLLDSQINQSEISLPKSTYMLDLKNGKFAYVFANRKNMTIDGNGSTIICNRQNQAFMFSNCENVTFKNLYIEYDPPCASQGTILQMSVDKRSWTVELHPGYPTSGLELNRILVYDKNTRELKHNLATLSTQSFNTIQTTPSTKLQFTIDGWTNPAVNPVTVGDYVSFVVASTGTIQAHTIIVAGCKNMNFENVTIYDSNCFSFYEYNCERNRYFRCVTTRKLNDPKYPVDRLRAGAADAFHSKYATVGPIVEECRLEYTGDDCIAINGNFYPVFASNKSEKSVSFLTTAASVSNVYVRTNDKFVCVNNDGSVRGRSVVASVQPVTPSAGERTATFAKLASVRDADKFVYGIKVYLDTWIEGCAIGDVIYSDDRIGRGFKILRDTVGGNRSRAILLKSSEGLVDGCVIRNSAMSGIAIAPEFYWMEAGCPNNVVIRNNTIDNCMFDANMTWTSQFAALVVVSEAPNGSFAPAGSLNNISIYNNKITNCPYPAVGVTSTNGVYFANNEITPASWTRTHGSSFGVTHARDLYRVNTVNFSTTDDVNAVGQLISIRKGELRVIVSEGMLVISLPNNGVPTHTRLYNAQGVEVLASDHFRIPVNQLDTGLYIVRTEADGIVRTARVIL